MSLQPPGTAGVKMTLRVNFALIVDFDLGSKRQKNKKRLINVGFAPVKKENRESGKGNAKRIKYITSASKWVLIVIRIIRMIYKVLVYAEAIDKLLPQ